ncbi:carbon-nitrogen hydrolase family protein [Mycolicibacterium mengxianglii]|nr:carbon-nitrogen hydrolase family protein [Mycolicibacterium mengxianglii]
MAAHFGRDIERSMEKLGGIIERLRAEGIDLLVLPDATLGGYIGSLSNPSPGERPPALDPDGPELRALCAMAGPMTVCVGYTERAVRGGDPVVYNAAACLSGDGILGRHRKVHQPARESLIYAAGDRFDAFDTPVGRIGMLIDYDKTFPESARTLALDGAEVIAALSAWPASVTDRAARMPNDRQARLFDLYDMARAAENQVVLASSNLTGITGTLRFLGQAKVVDPGGNIVAKTWSKGGLAVTDIDVAHEIARARTVLNHLRERRVGSYHPTVVQR